MAYDLGIIDPETIEEQDCCSIQIETVPECVSNLGIIPNLQCALDKHSEFTDFWDAVSLCDPDSPYLDEEDFYIDPEDTGLNCT